MTVEEPKVLRGGMIAATRLAARRTVHALDERRARAPEQRVHAGGAVALVNARAIRSRARPPAPS